MAQLSVVLATLGPESSCTALLMSMANLHSTLSLIPFLQVFVRIRPISELEAAAGALSV